MTDQHLVIGLGEVGRPIYELVSEKFSCASLDVGSPEVSGSVDVMHICYPFEIEDFIGVSVEYISKFNPNLVIIHSTILPGTSRKIAEHSGKDVAYSPVRGKHVTMKEHLGFYVKFLAGVSDAASEKALKHLTDIGLKTKVISKSETLELTKLSETTYFGVLIAWAQELERYCNQLGANYDEVVSFYEEIGFFPPVKYFPGIIGGHCVIPNIHLLKKLFDSNLLDAVIDSNEQKKKLEASKSSE